MTTESENKPTIQRHRVLVVEEKRINTRIIRQALPDDEYTVVEATTPERGMAECKNVRPALVVVDMSFADNGGYRLCRRLAKEGIGAVALEGHPTKATVTKAAQAGALDVLVAPPEAGTVRSRVRRVLVKCGQALPEGGEEEKIEFPSEVKDAKGKAQFVIKRAKSIMALPHAVSAVLRLCSEPNSSALDLARPLETDAALASSVLRLANSAASGSRERVTSLRAAIARLGTKATANLAVAQSVFKMFEKTSDTFGFDRREFWVHSLGAACCAQALASKCTHLDKDDAFLGALLHDLGKMVLDEYVPVDFQQAVRDSHARRIPLRVSEASIFSVDHSYVGQQVAAEWDLPEGLCQAIGNHHKCHRMIQNADTEEGGLDESIRFGLMTSFSSQLSKAMGFGHAGDLLIDEAALGLWAQTQDCMLVPGELRGTAVKELSEYLGLLGIRPTSFGVDRALEGAAPVLLCIPAEAPGLSLLLELFFSRRGFQVQHHDEMGTLPDTGTRYGMVVGFVDGNVAQAEAFGNEIAKRNTRGIVYASGDDAPKSATSVADLVYVSRTALDFHFLEEVLLSEGDEESRPDTTE